MIWLALAIFAALCAIALPAIAIAWAAAKTAEWIFDNPNDRDVHK